VTLLAREMLPPILLSPALLRWSFARTSFPLFIPMAPAPGKRSIREYLVGLGRRCFMQHASHNAAHHMASNQPTLASRGPVWTPYRLPIAPLPWVAAAQNSCRRLFLVCFRIFLLLVVALPKCSFLGLPGATT
jgi:hypothetical protein